MAELAKKRSPIYGKCNISYTSNFQFKPHGNKKILEIFSEPKNDRKVCSRNEKAQWFQTQLVIPTLQLIKQMKIISLWKSKDFLMEAWLKELAIGRVADGSVAVVLATGASGFVELTWCNSGPRSGCTDIGSMPLVLQVVPNLCSLPSLTRPAHACTKWKEA